MEWLIPICGITAVFGFPTGLLALFLRQRHLEKMRLYESQGNSGRVAQLEAARAELEARVRTLETIVTAGDHDLEARLRSLTASQGSALPRLSGK
jgi:hypothetical protein